MLNVKFEKGAWAPSYYGEFKCIAERCRHSCCIDWEICIDERTYEKYKQTDEIINTIEECADGPCFILSKDGRCPHLNGNGLCEIIIKHGEGYLSEICKNHPRFYNFMSNGRIEAGLGIVCEEACRLILENDKPFSLYKIEESYDDSLCEMKFDPLPQRECIISIIESDGDFDRKLTTLKRKFKISEPYTPNEWLDRFLSLEILDSAWERQLRSMSGRLFEKSYKDAQKYGKYYERLLTYFVYRHISVAENTENLCARLGFCILSAELIRSIFEWTEEHDLDTLIDIARRYSAEIEYSEDNTEELIFAFENNKSL